jgi:hypothetical protein
MLFLAAHTPKPPEGGFNSQRMLVFKSLPGFWGKIIQLT